MTRREVIHSVSEIIAEYLAGAEEFIREQAQKRDAAPGLAAAYAVAAAHQLAPTASITPDPENALVDLCRAIQVLLNDGAPEAGLSPDDNQLLCAVGKWMEG